MKQNRKKRNISLQKELFAVAKLEKKMEQAELLHTVKKIKKKC